MLRDLPLPELRQYRPAVEEPADFDEFWASELAAAAARDTEAHAIDRLDRAGSARPAVVDVEILDFEQPAHGARSARQDAQWPAPNWRGAGGPA